MAVKHDHPDYGRVGMSDAADWWKGMLAKDLSMT